MFGFIDVAIHNSRTVLLAIGFILVAGTIAFIEMPKEADPDVAIPIIYVSMSHEGISPEDGERLLVRPMEKELRAIEGVKEMTAVAGESYASVTLEFDAGFNSNKALQDVLQKVNIAKAKLPSETEEPVVNEVNVALFPIMVVTLAGDVPERTLLKMAQQMKDAIETIPEVLEVTISGKREEVVEIILDPLHIESYQLNYNEIFGLFQRNNQLVAAGALDTGQGRFNIKVPGVFESTTEILKLPVKVMGEQVITLGDIAQVRRTFKDVTTFARVNGKPALALEIKKRVGTNIINTIGQTRAIVAAVQEQWGNTNVNIGFIQDKSRDIKNMLVDLNNNVLSAIVLVTIIIVATMSIYNAMLVTLATPISFLGGILIMSYMGYTMNIVVLFSLILVSGMLVDAAIIVTEFADRRMAEGMNRVQAYSLAAKRMFGPVVGATLVTMIVFFPLLTWPGIVGEFMKYLPITVIITLAASLLVALIFTPTLGALFGRAPAKSMIEDDDNIPLAQLTGITGAYVKLLAKLIRHPLKVLFLALLVMFGVYWLYGEYGKGVEFFPDIEPEQAVVYVRTRGDLSVIERDKLVKQVEAEVLQMREFSSVYTSSGIVSSSNGASIPPDTIGIIQLELVDWQKRRKAKEIFAEIRSRTQKIAGVIIEVQKPDAGPSQGKPVKVEIGSVDSALLLSATAKFVSLMQETTGLIDIEDNRPLPGIDWKIKVDREQASRFGADIATVGSSVQLVTNGIKLGEYRTPDADEEMDIRARFPEEYRHLEQLDLLRIQTDNGLVPTSLFVTRRAEQQTGTILRSNEKRVFTVQANVQEGVLVDDMVTALKAKLKEQPFDQRISITFKGEDKEQREASEFLQRAFLVSIFLVTIVLVAQFNSFYQTLLILSAVIFSTVGVLLGLLLTSQPFGIVMNGISLIALVGVVVSNNIVLIDTYNLLRTEGKDKYEAVLRTCAQRLRPVFLTVITTVLGLVPMAIGMNIDLINREISMGAPSTQWWTQLSTAIAGGLSFATLLTLILTPCLLMLGKDGRIK